MALIKKQGVCLELLLEDFVLQKFFKYNIDKQKKQSVMKQKKTN